MEKSELELAGCLRRLLRSRYILRTRNESTFKMVIDHRLAIQTAVGAFAAHLEINEPLGVIFLRSISDEVDEQLGIRLSRPRELGAHASALLLNLRWQRLQFYLQPTGDDVPVTGTLEMREFLQQFSRAKLDTQFERQFRRAIEDLTQLQVIIETALESGIYEITPLCDLLLPADQIHQLRARAEVYFAKVGGESIEGDGEC